jgi:hypothetical protein
MNRREFHKLAGAGVIVLSTGGLEACSPSNVATDIINWAPVGKETIDSVMLVLSSNGIVPAPAVLTAQKDADAAIDALVTAAQKYNSISPPPAGALQEVQAGFSAVTSSLGAFLQAIALPPGNIMNLIIGIAQIVFSTITAFSNRLPAPVATAMTRTLSGQHTVGGTPFAFTPKDRTRRQFKKDVNATLDTGKKAGVTVPKAAYLPVTLAWL